MIMHVYVAKLEEIGEKVASRCLKTWDVGSFATPYHRGITESFHWVLCSHVVLDDSELHVLQIDSYDLPSKRIVSQKKARKDTVCPDQNHWTYLEWFFYKDDTQQ